MDELNFELSLEQNFEYARMVKDVENLSRDEMKDLLLKSAKLLMAKDAVIKILVRKSLGMDFGSTVEQRAA
jgi:Phycobilisome degradation protein nblA